MRRAQADRGAVPGVDAASPVSAAAESQALAPGLSSTSSFVSSSFGKPPATGSLRVAKTDSARLDYPWHEDKQPLLSDNARGWWNSTKDSFRHMRETYGWLDWLGVFLPCVRWLRTYKIRQYLLSDIIAGVSVGFMVVPQGLSYANLAGLPSVYGLYGAFIPCLVYSLVGSSRQLAVGPVAVTSLLIGTKLKDLLPESAVISNPNTPTAEQVKYILGFSIPRQERLQDQSKTYINNMHNLKWQEFIMGTVFLILLVTFKEVGKRSTRFKWLRPIGPLTVCIIGLLAVYIGKVDRKGIKIIGSIPPGLPKPTVSWWFPMPEVAKLFPTAIVVMLVDLLESTSIARALARKNKYELVANQEIVGLGLANFGGAIFNCYTTTGSFSRSAVNNESGAKSGLACFVTAWVVGFVLIFLTKVFSNLPYCTLGAIIVSSIVGLLEYEQAIYLFKVNKLDFLVWMASFLGVLFISVEIGLGIAIGLAVLIVVYESAFPNTALVGRIPGTNIWRNIKQYPHAQLSPGIMVVRIDAPIYFANITWIKERLVAYEESHRAWSAERGVPLEYCILDFSPVTHVDATAVHTLEELTEQHLHNGTQVVIANPAAAVVRALERSGLMDMLGREWVFVTVDDAVTFCSREMAERGHVVVQPAAGPEPPSGGVGKDSS
ncbi:hypothetical protein GPECTOR_65g203 [Gonium pectorale]|uniref:STAS domain-containing protein n=1 Tax=Gonium pectorale TaxID=33097 RepID=A0A150G4X6_GONPE|nr:hypothetical protein GPECTOR_65g203 [Gonium pectorale]|eukprot:KXZ44585.1 hypothetical protein GPECTOR_65g203 [Gonium pectorale]